MNIDTSDEACAMACMLVSNPRGKLRKDGDGWQKRVNDLIRALRDERNDLRAERDDYKDVADDLGKFCAIKDAEIERLRAVLQDIAALYPNMCPEITERVQRALEQPAPAPKTERRREELKRAEDMLARAEGFFAAAAYTEQHSPPFKQGRAWQELVDVRDLLADLHRVNGQATEE
jgi:hypothetical protein